MNMRHLNLTPLRLLIPAILSVMTFQAHAATFSLVSAGPPTWTYELTFAPLDNCNLFTNPTTITLTGLTGVTAAGQPTSTDFPGSGPGSLAANNLNWVPTFTNTSVTWANPTCGSGNFNVEKHVYGFTVTATGGPGTYVTNGFAKDTHSPNSVDVTSPTTPPPAPAAVPVMSPMAFVMTMIGLGCAGAWESRRRLQDWFGSHSNQA
jgi:hypothetical protein